MKDAYKWKWISVAMLFVLLVIFFPFNKPLFKFDFDWSMSHEDEIIERNEEIIDSLQRIIESNNAKQLEYDLQISALTDSVAELQYIVKRRENTIANIKKQTNEILNRVSQFNSSDVLQWSSERYKDSLNIK